MLASEAAESMMEEIYPLLYHALPRLPSYLSKQNQMLKEGQFSILLLLDTITRKNKEISCKEIANITMYSRSTVTRETKELKEKLLIKKARRIHPPLTMVDMEILPKGKEVLSKEMERRKEAFEKMFTYLNQQEREHLIIGLRKMVMGYRRD